MNIPSVPTVTCFHASICTPKNSNRIAIPIPSPAAIASGVSGYSIVCVKSVLTVWIFGEARGISLAFFFPGQLHVFNQAAAICD